MRITILANRDIASNLAINYLLRTLPDDQFNIMLSTRVGASGTRHPALDDLRFFEQTLFNQLFFPALDHRFGKSDTQLFSFEALQGSGIPVREVASINDQQGLDLLAISKPHLILSVRFGLILKAQAIAIPEFGVLNLHSGILPDYRGVMATFWAMLNDELKIGTTLHYIKDAGIDTGDIISIQTQETDYQRSYLSNVLSLYESGVMAMSNAIQTIRSGRNVKTQKQPKDAGSYYSLPDSQALETFQRKGLKLINHEEIVDFARQYL